MASPEKVPTDPDQDPLAVTEVDDLIFPSPEEDFRDTSYGKWMIFKQFKDLTKTWQSVVKEMKSGCLKEATGAKCSTLRYNPLESGAGPTTMGMITVYTKKEYMAIGKKLIQLPVVQHDIKYKLQEDKGKYSHIEQKPVTAKTLYWNNGKPSTWYNRKVPSGKVKREYDSAGDIWKINIVDGASHYNKAEIDGYWIAVSNYISEINISKLWHQLKPRVESGEIPAIVMECPDSDRWRGEPPQIHLYTSEDKRKEVGEKLIQVMKEDITYCCEGSEDNYQMKWNQGNITDDFEHKLKIGDEDKGQPSGGATKSKSKSPSPPPLKLHASNEEFPIAMRRLEQPTADENISGRRGRFNGREIILIETDGSAVEHMGLRVQIQGPQDDP